MKPKKAQMKMTETILIVIVFFILFFVGMGFYSGYKENQFEKKQTILNQEEAIELATELSYIPEISCNGDLCVDCQTGVDLLKLKAFAADFPGRDTGYAGLVNESLVYYAPIFKTSDIRIKVFDDLDGIIGSDFNVHASDDTITDILVYSNEPEDWNDVIAFYKPINVYDPISGRCNYAMLNISLYK